MELQLQHPGDYPHVHHVEHHAITIVHGQHTRTLEHSFILGNERIIEDWAVGTAEGCRPDDLAPILALQPDVVLLGTGDRQVFPAGEVMATFLERGIGLESMDNAAAARTHTILAGEDRHVVAAFILPQDTSDDAYTGT